MYFLGFLAKKQITRKGLLDEAPPRQRRMDSYEDDFGNGVTIFPDDPYSRLVKNFLNDKVIAKF